MSPNIKATTTKAATRFSAEVSRNFSLRPFNLERQLFFNRRTPSFQFAPFAAVEPRQNDNGREYPNRRSALLIPRTINRDAPRPARRGSDRLRRLRIEFRGCDAVCCSQYPQWRLIQRAVAE